MDLMPPPPQQQFLSALGSSGTASPGHDPAWQNLPGLRTSICGRRHSTVSDSGDTGIGTYCSDSTEDDCSSCTTPLSFQPLLQPRVSQCDDDGAPVAQVRPSFSTSPRSPLQMPASPRATGHWSESCQPPLSATSPLACLDIKDSHPIRRWFSLTKLSSGDDKSFTTTPSSQYNTDRQGSLDRSRLYRYRKDSLGSSVDMHFCSSSPLTRSSLLHHSQGSSPSYRHHQCSSPAGLNRDISLCPGLTSALKQNNLDMNFTAFPQAKLTQGGGSLGRQLQRGSTVQPAVCTQMWLTDLMEHQPRVECTVEHGPVSSSGPKDGGDDGQLPWQQGKQQKPWSNQMPLRSLPANIMVKVKEDLLRHRELEIDRQKQHIVQLHARIRENELRAHQVLHNHRGQLEDFYIPHNEDSAVRLPCRWPSDHLCCDEDLSRKLAIAELEVIHLNQVFKQVTQKHTEDIRKLEERIKTRDRYITSLKKKCQRESDQNQENQQRIETLEKYLSDLPTPNEVQAQVKKQMEVQQKAKDLEKTVSRLQKSLDEGCAVMKEKDIKIEMQTKREKELIASVHTLQQKVQQCLDDGVRLPMQDLKRLEVERTQLLEQQDRSSKLFKHQKEQIEKLTSQLMATSTRLQIKRGISQQSCMVTSTAFPQRLIEQGSVYSVERPEVRQLLKEMSLCLLDLQGLCSILVQRAQGKEPNLSLLLGMKSFNFSAEESDCKVVEMEEELKFKLLEVGQLRRDIDELRRNISDHYVQFMCNS
ncbi:centrosomal protein of 85 kDa-like [Pholidichthys leucotaenia]